METWVVEKITPFEYVGQGSDGQYVDNFGSQKDSAFISVEDGTLPEDAAKAFRDLHPFHLPKTDLGFLAFNKNVADRFYKYLTLGKNETATVFYKWRGTTLFSANVAHFDLLGG